jgi:hypothetical protein
MAALKSSSLSLSTFNLSNIADGSVIVAIAKRKSGKTVLIKELCYSKRKFGCGVLICPTEEMNQNYLMFFPDLFIHYDINLNLLKRVLERQKLIIKKMNAKHQKGKTLDPRTLLIMDDCMGQKGSWIKDPTIEKIFVEGRHYQITYILALQDPMHLPCGYRNNIDYVFMLQCKSVTERVKLREHYAGVIDRKVFDKIFFACTANYGCMVVDVTAISAEISNNIFHYRVQPEDMDRVFAFGSRNYRAYHKKYYDDDYMERDTPNRLKEILDINAPGVILR